MRNADCWKDLWPVINTFDGPGKTNLAEALDFLSKTFNNGLSYAVAERGGPKGRLSSGFMGLNSVPADIRLGASSTMKSNFHCGRKARRSGPISTLNRSIMHSTSTKMDSTRGALIFGGKGKNT